MTSKKKTELIDKFMPLARPIGKIRMDYVKKNIVPFLIVKDDRKTGYCTFCEQEMEMPKTKHNQECNCPKCNHKVQVIHSWRRQLSTLNRTNWYAFPQVIDEDTVMLRYILTDCFYDKVVIEERARQIIDFKAEKTYEFERNRNSQDYLMQRKNFFRIPTFYMGNHYYCGCADEIKPYFFSELGKLRDAKYNEKLIKSKYSYETEIETNIIHIYSKIGLLEKLNKVNLADKININARDFSFDRTQSELTKMLLLNKNTLNILKKYPSNKSLKWLQKNPNCTEEDFIKAKIIDYDFYNEAYLRTIGITINQLYKYAIKQNENLQDDNFFVDYKDYVRNLIDLDYKLDKSYLFPKDFRKEKNRVTLEYIHKHSNGEEDKKKSLIIKKISELIKGNNQLSNWIQGEKGLQIYVPESVDDLKLEGKRLHNCIGTYCDRIANKNTLVFFVRKLSDPDKEYVAFEYSSSGQVVQIRENRNANCENSDVISFVKTFCSMLNNINVYKLIAA